MKVELGEVIAKRRLRVTGRPDLDVWVVVGKPRPLPDGPDGDCYCPYQVTGIGDEKVRYAVGIDSIQALELAIHILPTELDRLRKGHPGLRWEDAAEGAYGFSKAVSAFAGGDTPKP